MKYICRNLFIVHIRLCYLADHIPLPVWAVATSKSDRIGTACSMVMHPNKCLQMVVAEPNVKIHELARDLSAIGWLRLFSPFASHPLKKCTSLLPDLNQIKQLPIFCSSREFSYNVLSRRLFFLALASVLDVMSYAVQLLEALP